MKLPNEIVQYLNSFEKEFRHTESNRTVIIVVITDKQLIDFYTFLDLRFEGYSSYSELIFKNINYDLEEGFRISFEKNVTLHKDSFDFVNDSVYLRLEFFS